MLTISRFYTASLKVCQLIYWNLNVQNMRCIQINHLPRDQYDISILSNPIIRITECGHPIRLKICTITSISRQIILSQVKRYK